MEGYFTYSNFWQIYDQLYKEFPQYISEKKELGKTYLGNNMYYFKVGDQIHDPSRNKRSEILFTALHHAREPTSLSLILTILIDQLRVLNASKGKNLLYYAIDLIFIPIVNVDTYKMISDAYGTRHFHKARMLRKNRRKDNSCSRWKAGVDLNRNYGYKWNFNPLEGGSNQSCAIDYRGTKPFSEPETFAMKAFIENNKRIVSCMNFHAWGDLWIHPFNYTRDRKNIPLKKKHRFWKIYQEFAKDSPHMPYAKFGNAAATIEYMADGEASDWMLHEHNIVSLSPEIGNDDKESETFWLRKGVIPNVLKSYYPTVEYFIKMHKIKLIDEKVHFDGKNVRISVFNAGLSNLANIKVEIVLFANPAKIKLKSIDCYTSEEHKGTIGVTDKRSMEIKNYENKKVVGTLDTFIKRRSYMIFEFKVARFLSGSESYKINVYRSNDDTGKALNSAETSEVERN